LSSQGTFATHQNLIFLFSARLRGRHIVAVCLILFQETVKGRDPNTHKCYEPAVFERAMSVHSPPSHLQQAPYPAPHSPPSPSRWLPTCSATHPILFRFNQSCAHKLCSLTENPEPAIHALRWADVVIQWCGSAAGQPGGKWIRRDIRCISERPLYLFDRNK